MSLSNRGSGVNLQSKIYESRLKDGQIRVARIHRGSVDDPIICTLETIPITSERAYEALSWYWGKPNPQTDPFIRVNGSQFQIPANLEPALRKLRLVRDDFMVWCDAICINQADIAEKAMQVGSMGHLYTNAARVCVWLGEADSDSRMAFKKINQVAKKLKGDDDGVQSMDQFMQGRSFLLEHIPSFRKWLRQKRLLRDDDLSDISAWAACSRLLRRPWFRRLWVIQEVCFTKRPIPIYCGPDRSYLAWLQWLVLAEPYAFDLKQFEDLREAGYNTMNCALIDHIGGYRAPDAYDVLQVLWNLRFQECSLAHDRVYAIRSMIPQLQIKVDYQAPAWKAFRDITVHCIQEARSLRVFAACLPFQNRVPDCPSWVPDWSTPAGQRPWQPLLDWYPVRDPDENMGDIGGLKYLILPPPRASGSHMAEVLALTETTIRIRGAFLDTLSDASVSFREMNPRLCDLVITGEANSSASPISEFHLAHCISAAIVAPGAVGDGFKLFLNQCYRISLKCTAGVIARTLHGGAVRSFSDSSNGVSTLQYLTSSLSADKKDHLDSEPNARVSNAILRTVVACCNKRRYCMTGTGCPALVPEDARAGDHIVLLFGSDVPFVLRPVDPKQRDAWTYSLVGECFLDGVMYGEIMGHIENGPLKANVKEFTIV